MYKIVEISSKYEIEQLGTKEKFWVKDEEEGIKQLFKIGRDNTGENWAEKVACEIASLLGLPHAHYELAKYKDKMGTLSNSFIGEDERLVHGNELMIKVVNSDYPIDQFYKVRDYKVETVLSLVKKMEKHFKIQNSVRDFIGYIVFDCLIANQDRHHENWGYIIDSNQKLRLAPTYDHAAGLGCRVSVDEATKRLKTNDANYTVEAFCKRARTPFYVKGSSRLSTLEACRVAARFDSDVFCFWVDKISTIKADELKAIFKQIPSEYIEEGIRIFGQEVIEVNSKRLVALKEEFCK